jgi:hypothetical protein
MRQIEQFVQALAGVLFKKKRQEQILVELDNLGKQYLGLDLKLLCSMTSEELFAFFNLNESFINDRCFMAAELLNHYCAMQYKLHKNHDELFDLYLKNFELYYAAMYGYEPLQNELVFNKLNQLYEILKIYELPKHVTEKMFHFLELFGRFDKAEDMLFMLIESGDKNVLSLGEQFYNRLLNMHDEQLKAGNLPRDEVVSGLKALQAHNV